MSGSNTTEDVMTEFSPVVNPEHYKTGKFECIDVMLETQGVEAVRGFCICNAFKYLYRHRNKKGLEDVLKARWYLDKYIELADDKQYYGPEADALFATVLADNGYPLDKMDEWAPPEGVLG